MSQSSSPRKNEFGPNYLGYCKHLFFEVCSENEDSYLPHLGSDVEQLGYSRGKVEGIPSQNNVAKGKSCGNPVSFFNRVIGEGLPEYKKDRLKAVLHDTAVSLNQEANEIFGQILVTLLLKSKVCDNELFPCCSNALDEELNEPICNKKQKSSTLSNKSDSYSSIFNTQIGRQVYNDIQAIHEDNEICQEAVEKYSNRIIDKLFKMEDDLEGFIDQVVSKCRPMTHAEKQQLGRRIQKLPDKARGRVVEIFYRRHPSARKSNNIFIDLEEQDNATLWRLYYYVQTVLKANKI